MIHEDKQEICKALCAALQMTRQLSRDLKTLEYTTDDEDEYVIARFNDGSSGKIDVTADSGFAMINDVMWGLEWSGR